MDRFELSHRAQARIGTLKGAGLHPRQTARIHSLGQPDVLSALDLNWGRSLAEAILDGYFVSETELVKLTQLVSHDNEGYLYFDGIRGDNAGDGVEPYSYVSGLDARADAFEQKCIGALLAGRTVQQRDLPEVDSA